MVKDIVSMTIITKNEAGNGGILEQTFYTIEIQLELVRLDCLKLRC